MAPLLFVRARDVDTRVLRGDHLRMAATQTMRADEREFFSVVAQAVFTNPFSDERAEIDSRLMGHADDGPYEERSQSVAQAVIARMQDLERADRADVRLYEGKDREILSYAFLFDIYHRFKDAFDALIVEQIDAGENPCSVGFAAETLALFRQRGFTPDEALEHFATFYQIRRAFYFIDGAITGISPCMKELRRNLWNNIFTSDIRWYDRYLRSRMEDFSTLLLGETGTGKGSAASAIGRSGLIPFEEKRGRFAESFTQAFVSINLSQYPETLIESELFGHRKGAFTGAVEDHQGIFARCSPCGSILLDEIGEVSIPVQIKLLQVLQERFFVPVGSREEKRFRGRVIAATNRSMSELREKDAFRDDFFYRLCSDVIVSPPLRQRIAEDPRELDLLLERTIERILGEASNEVAELTRQSIRTQLGDSYAWPGNVRELEQCVRRIILKRRYEGDGHLGGGDLRDTVVRGIDSGTLNAQQVLASYCTLLYQRLGTYEQVAQRTGLDRRTVKKYIGQWQGETASADTETVDGENGS
jgi:transcriptional regulator with AAA-type ATPase domain